MSLTTYTDLEQRSEDWFAARCGIVTASVVGQLITAKSPLRNPVIVCGSAFPELRVRRHRAFESNVPIVGTGHHHARQGTPAGVYGQHPDSRRYYRPDGTQRGTKALSLKEGRAAMGIDWMSWADLAEAIPPQYTEYIGRQLLAHIAAVAA